MGWIKAGGEVQSRLEKGDAGGDVDGFINRPIGKVKEVDNGGVKHLCRGERFGLASGRIFRFKDV